MTKIDKRENAVNNAIHTAIEGHCGEYKGNAVSLGLAFSMMIQAMKDDDAHHHEGCANAAIDFLIQGGYLLQEPAVVMPKLEA